MDSLAKQGQTWIQFARAPGLKTTFGLNNRLVNAGQASGRPVPAFKPPRKTPGKRMETVEVKRGGKGDAFGVNVPREPLTRAGIEPGAQPPVKASKGRTPFLGRAMAS